MNNQPASPVSPVSNEEHKQKYSAAIRGARLAGQNAFHAWFNKAKDVHQSVVRGHWDLTFHILTPKICEYIETPEEKTALEIGYGGGRILNAACNYFKEVIGVDIHDEQETVETFLKNQRKNNFRLIRTPGDTLAVASQSIDFIYSFIVLQHLPSFDTFVSYIKETHRCLKSGGLAQLYFGKYSQLSLGDQLRYFNRGYLEIVDAPTNHTSLVIRLSKVKKVCYEHGLKVIDVGGSYKQSPDGYPHKKGSQNYVTLLRR